MRAFLRTADLHYGNGVQLHTASSGSVPGLQALYLHLEDGEHRAIGEVRINIAYLNGYSPEQVIYDALRTLSYADWQQPADLLLKHLDTWANGCSLPVRNLLDSALHDLVAKQEGLPLAAWLNNSPLAVTRWATNQTLFWSPFETFVAQAEAYVARGFRDLKVRVAVGDFAEDLRRIAALRERFGSDVKLAADANGQWSPEEAMAHLDGLAEYGLSYIEQPIAPGDWDAMSTLASASPIPLMLDESLASPADIGSLCDIGGQLWAHLKLVKLGGIGPTMQAARKLKAAGVPFMIGQMNEGAAATAAALHVACASGPQFAELYGADGLIDDAASGVRYADGFTSVISKPGLGVDFDASPTQLIRSFP